MSLSPKQRLDIQLNLAMCIRLQPNI